MKHPYENLMDYCSWYKAMTAPAPGHIDPVTKYSLISKNDKISTMGSCFAQHLSKQVSKSGFNYFVPEVPLKNLSKGQALQKNYGVFSARYGNVYTARQAIQLFSRAFGKFSPEENFWFKDGRYYDSFRPSIQPDGFSCLDELIADREMHFTAVRRIFLESDWLIFTLGLTEAWSSRKDGAIFPVAPGVSGGTYSPTDHEFINFDYSSTYIDLKEFIEKIKLLNPSIKFILTVSPVPLIATYENRHVLVSTTASKSILRAVADQIEREMQDVYYFPSYEIITSSANCGTYFESDLRQVTDLGVNHVMRMFTRHFLTNEDYSNNHDLNNYTITQEPVVCDEELIELAIKNSGF
jgi:hypothetical protein